MRVLGVDPGIATCGYGVVESAGNALHMVTYGAVETDKGLAVEQRLQLVYEGISALIETYKPEAISVEQLFFNRNVTTAIVVGEARGVILLAASQHDLPVMEYTPYQVKQSVVGYGKATKEQVMLMVQRLLALRIKPRPDDAADALAMAICGLHSSTYHNWQERSR